MKIPSAFLTTLLLATAAIGPAWAQETEAGRPTDVTGLIEQLGDAEYKVRKDAEQQLLEIGKAAAGALKKGAEQHDDPEVKWRAARILRKIEAGDGAGRAPLKARSAPEDRRGEGLEDGRQPRTWRSQRGLSEVFDRLRQDLQERGIDGGFDEEIDRAMREAHERLRSLPGLREGWERDIQRVSNAQRRSMQMSSGPDGVRVEIEEIGPDGEVEKKVYEAEDMESFRARHPGVLDGRSGLGFRVVPGLPGMPGLGRLAPLAPRHAMPREEREESEEVRRDEGPKLGFYVGELPPAVHEYLGLEDGVGLMVDRIVPDSLADTLGMRPRDILVEVSGQKVGGAEDVQTALEKIGEGEVRVQVLRQGRPLELSTRGEKAAEQQEESEAGGGKKTRVLRLR